ncbi:PAS domain S-box protein [Flaviaesturariibacter amylovorans]|uniref:histidine kinase n=1 Tax=Flaviaesturariibacter amylovorans TaxID=1084520 RepID=A0ABP8HNV6_9BACT
MHAPHYEPTPPGSPDTDKLRSLFQQAPAAIALLEGPALVYRFANPLYQQIFSRSEAELLGRTPRTVFPEMDGQGVYELFDRVYQSGEPFVATEFPVTFHDGAGQRSGYYNFVVQPIRNDAGTITDLMVHAYEVTAQVEARRQVTESDSKYRSLFNSMEQGFCVIEMIFDAAGEPVDYRFVEANPVFAAQTGLTDAVGKTARALVPALEARWFRIYGDVARTGRSVKLVEGSEAMGRWFEVNAFRVASGGSNKVAILFTDITEQRAAERALREQRQLLQAVFDASPNSLVVLAPVYNAGGAIEDFEYVMANAVTAQTTGRTDLAGKRLAESFPNARTTGLLERFIRVAETGTTEEFEQWYEGEGRHQWFRLTVSPVGTLLVVTTEDITARRESEEGLRKSEHYFRQLTDTVPAIIWITRPDGYCTYLNKNWYAYTGQTAGEAEGFGWLEATHPDDAAEAGRRFIEASEKQVPYHVLYRLRHHSGEYRWAIDSGQPKFGEDGSFEGMVGTVIDVHEQKLAEDKIRESEQRFRSMADASPVMIWTLDEQGNSTYYNRQARAFTGHTEQDLEEGKSWQVAIHPDDIGDAAAVVGDAVQRRVPYEFECRMQNARGEWRWLLNHGTPRFGNEGEYFGFVGSSIDITARKEAEAALAGSEDRFRSIFNTAGVSIWEEDFTAAHAAITGLKAGGVTDVPAYMAAHPEFVQHCIGLVRVLDVNDATIEMFEAPNKEAVLENLGNIFLPETVPVFVTELLHLTEGATSYASECRLRTLKGNSLYVLFSMRLTTPGAFDRVLFTLQDITERKAAEETIRESEHRFRLLVEAFPHLAWTASPEGKTLYFNQRWYTYTGLPETAAMDSGSGDVLHPADRPRATALWEAHLRSGAPAELELRYREGATGDYRWFLVKTVPVKKDDGSVLLWIGTATDIHEQKIAMEGLESLVEERTKELQRSNDDLQQFAHVASHDLKEPVRKVKTFLNRLEQHLEGRLDETGTRYIERIHSAASRMSTMIDGVLKYSTFNAAVELAQPVALSEVIASIETDLEVAIQRTGTRIEYAGLPTIEGAPVLLYQVFYNLVNNSIKFAKAGVAPVIKIRSERLQQGDRSFEKIVLSDNGIGFEEEQASAIFDTFKRLHPKDKYEGTGLGLALCKKIVERHGGSIVAHGAPGVGASFTILLPSISDLRSGI